MGSKNLESCIPYPAYKNLEEARGSKHKFNVLCFDQEPLNFDFYENIDQDKFLQNTGIDPQSYDWPFFDRTLKNLDIVIDRFHSSVYDSTILIHSEQNSWDVFRYFSAGYEPVHYWCHGVIARDWFRFAQYDQRLQASTMPDKDFLIYSRDWSGSREYRLKFLELATANDLVSVSKYYFKDRSSDSNCSVKDYQFKNYKLLPQQLVISSELLDSQVDSTASADYDAEDHVSTKISVVLETQFDNQKIHLTEKVCRALACGHPFILAAGPGSLEYLKAYGFQTFSPWLDESYDKETCSVLRLEKIVSTMKKFSSLPLDQKQETWKKITAIAKLNQQRFFSDEFASQLSTELETNLNQALANARHTRGQKFLRKRRIVKAQTKDRKQRSYKGLADHLRLLRTLRKTL